MAPQLMSQEEGPAQVIEPDEQFLSMPGDLPAPGSLHRKSRMDQAVGPGEWVFQMPGYMPGNMPGREAESPTAP